MPRATKSRPDPGATYRCWQSFAAHGLHGVVRRDERRSGDDPVVRQHFGYFVREGEPEPTLFDELVERHEQEHHDPAVDLWLFRRPREFRPEAYLPEDLPAPDEIAGLARSLTVSVGLDGTGGVAEVLRLKRSTKFLRSEPIVTEIPDAFENGTKT